MLAVPQFLGNFLRLESHISTHARGRATSTDKFTRCKGVIGVHFGIRRCVWRDGFPVLV